MKRLALALVWAPGLLLAVTNSLTIAEKAGVTTTNYPKFHGSVWSVGGTMTESIRMSANSRCSQRSIRARIVNRLYAATAFVKNYGSSVKAYRESPAPTTRYC